ncbi:hypothetical protein GCM10010109_16330 [Actinoplanes campanulatus]|nr:hypothetical protein GCM10010109_16330 [Actinoplanes campanulatus]GID36140.1 hypothetical protein Aca09nite_26460 [Actinoplanes campanulatus]
MLWGEVEVYQGRMFVTQGRFTTGAHIADGASDEQLGQTILDVYAMPSEPWKNDRGPWREFCANVVGIPADRYRPEKSARVFQRMEKWTFGTYFDPDVSIPGDATPAELGAFVRRELAALEPDWPTVRCAAIETSAAGGVVVMPAVRTRLVGPARPVEAEAGPLLAAVRAALADSDDDRREHRDYLEALAAADIDPRLLRGAARLAVEELSTGTIRITGVGSAGNRPVEHQVWLGSADDLAAVCDEVLRMLPELRVEHLPPGTPTGESFGIKICWLAVRGSTVEEVAAAVGLEGAWEEGWEEGVAAAYEDGVFVSPPAAGWIFVVGQVLGAPMAADLSARLGAEVQFFGNHRVVDYAECALAVGGRLIRHVYCCEGVEGCQQQGEPTPVEIELGWSDDWWIDQDDVMRIAAAWSIDPHALNVTESSPRPGLLGRIDE